MSYQKQVVSVLLYCLAIVAADVVAIVLLIYIVNKSLLCCCSYKSSKAFTSFDHLHSLQVTYCM